MRVINANAPLRTRATAGDATYKLKKERSLVRTAARAADGFYRE